MAGRRHEYEVVVEWTGNRGQGTASYRSYERSHEIRAGAKPPIPGSSDPSFRGDPARWNPEDLLVASLSACHKLWYLSLCAGAGVVVTAYRDEAHGTMVEEADGGGRFERVTLRPRATLAPGSDPDRALALHHEAHAKCFVARSVAFEVACEPTIEVASDA